MWIEKVYFGWICWFILFYGKCYLDLMGEVEVGGYLFNFVSEVRVSVLM